MSLADFYSLEPDYMAAIFHAWNDHASATQQGAWERTRMLASITIQPHVRKKIKPRDLLQFPWEKNAKKKESVTISKDEQMKRLNSRLKTAQNNSQGKIMPEGR